MLTLLRRRNFGLLWFGGLISLTGDWMLLIALPLHVYQQTGSTLATSGMLMAKLLPDLLLGSVAGVFVDRWDRRRTMVFSNLARVVILLPLLGVRSVDSLWVVYVVAFLESILTQFFVPAENALLPRLVEEERLLIANSLNSLNNNLARLIGPAIGGVVTGLYGLSGVALLDAGSYLIAGVMISLISVTSKPVREKVESSARTITSSLAGVWREWAAGLLIVRHERVVMVLFVLLAMTAVGEGIFGALYVPFVTEVLGGDELALGWLMTAQAVGGLLGGALIGRWGRRLPPHRLLGLCAIAFGALDIAMFNARSLETAAFPALPLAIALIVLVGIPAVGAGASLSTLLQSGVPDEYRGRVFGALGTTGALMGMAGLGLAGVLGEVVGIVPMLNVDGGLYMLAGALALVLLAPAMSGKATSSVETVEQQAGRT